MNLSEYIDPMINILHVVTWYILYSIGLVHFLNYSGWQGVDAHLSEGYVCFWHTGNLPILNRFHGVSPLVGFSLALCLQIDWADDRHMRTHTHTFARIWEIPTQLRVCFDDVVQQLSKCSCMMYLYNLYVSLQLFNWCWLDFRDSMQGKCFTVIVVHVLTIIGKHIIFCSMLCFFWKKCMALLPFVFFH